MRGVNEECMKRSHSIQIPQIEADKTGNQLSETSEPPRISKLIRKILPGRPFAPRHAETPAGLRYAPFVPRRVPRLAPAIRPFQTRCRPSLPPTIPSPQTSSPQPRPPTTAPPAPPHLP